MWERKSVPSFTNDVQTMCLKKVDTLKHLCVGVRDGPRRPFPAPYMEMGLMIMGRDRPSVSASQPLVNEGGVALFNASSGEAGSDLRRAEMRHPFRCRHR